MEDQNIFDYQYTMLDSPESSRLVINMDAPETSGDAGALQHESSSSACKPLPAFPTFKQSLTMSENSCWYQLPSVDERSTTTETYTNHQLSESDGVSSAEKQESPDRSFDIESILGLERHCYSPRHSTPAKDVCNKLTDQVSETGNHLQSNPSVNTGKYATFDMNSLISATNPGQVSADPSMYKRQEDKPPYTYVAMVIVAILNSEEKELSLSEIREKLEEMFPFFRGEYKGWKNSIRHALSNSKCFYKVEKKDENDISTMYVWKVDNDCVKSYTFNRQSKGPKSENYKFTLQEELGLPPFSPTLGKGIKLPPKPCFIDDSVSITGSASEDFLSARNDSIPTPQSTISDFDGAHYNTIDKRTSLKRKRSNEIPSMEQTTQASKRQTTAYNYPGYTYGYQQYSQSSRPYNPSYYSYYNPTALPGNDHWSRDFNQYGYQQQYGSQTMNSNVYSNEIQAVRNMWWTYYNGMVPSTAQPSQNTNYMNWYPPTPLNLTKCDEEKH